MPNEFNYSAFIAYELPKLKESLGDDIEDISWDGATLTIITMEEEPHIITELYRFHSQHDVDIMGYDMRMDMVQDDDDNFITTMKITNINAHN